MQITSRQILNVLLIISAIIFVGICIEAGGFIFNSFFTLRLNPVGAKHFWKQVDLSALYYHDRGWFLVINLLMIIVAILKAILFYLIIKLLYNKKFSMEQPFSKTTERFIFGTAYLALGIGFFSLLGAKYSAWFVTKGLAMPDVQYMGLGGGDVWWFMCVVLFVIGYIIRRGTEIQSENDLTV